MKITVARYAFVYFTFFQCFATLLSAQYSPSAKFTFNNGDKSDEVSGQKARLVNVSFTRDRFDNENNAVFISGSNYSYVNLGTYKDLKPREGAVSMWVKLDGFIYSGSGGLFNPILLTKQYGLNDFYEAYCIYYFAETKKMAFISSKDSLQQVVTYSKERNFFNRWFHLVISYSDQSISIFIDGKEEGTIPKRFPTRFMESDSVMVGHSANKKNQRFMVGSVDDIYFFDHPLTGGQVLELYHAPDPNKNAIIIKWLLIIVSILIGLVLLYFYIRHRVKVAVRIEKQRSERANIALENELRINRALMNPHFIFNTLNGLQDLILKREYNGANDYLIKFSMLLRKILESNMSDVISLELEIELLTRYIEIEDMRFEENFSYSVTTDKNVIPSITIIPIMTLQPFVENAIWHGLRGKEGNKSIRIHFELSGTRYLKCTIEDNGLGRKNNHTSKEKKSLATVFIRQRLELMNKIHGLHCSLQIDDGHDGHGTLVTLILPVLNG